jgi:maltose alpha-D-glucosyltransferase / alpha-amylase
VELDLSAWQGCRPHELTGGVPFPRIGELPYLLTLPGHGFYWFSIKKSVEEAG